MLRRMTAIILGVTAMAVLQALVFPDSGGTLPGQSSTIVSTSAAVPESNLTPHFSPTKFQTAQPQGPADSISPLELARSINKARRAEVVELNATWQKLGIDAGSFEVCGSGCEAKV